jgi:Domain of unknown function (DUF4169)
MSAQIINLRLARKRRERGEKGARATRNRALHGQSKAEHERQRLLAERAARKLEAHRREPPAYPLEISDESITDI